MLLAATVTALALLGAEAAELVCPDEDWMLFQEQCYRVSTARLPWTGVAAACAAADSRVQPVSVHSQLTNALVDSLLGGDAAWLGLGRNSTASNFTWLDGSDVDYVFWDDDQPADGHNCALINSNNYTGQWATADCSSPQLYVCQVPGAPVCPDQTWAAHGQHCYSYHSDPFCGGGGQAGACRKFSSQAGPVSIHDKATNDFVCAHVDKSISRYPWIGLQRDNMNASWRWMDGSPVDYVNWSPYYPITNGDCAVMEFRQCVWHDISCGGWQPVLCEV